jgi:hypothetical protein
MLPFLSHLIKGFFRSSSAGKEIAMRLVFGLVAIGLVAYLFFVGIALEAIIVRILKYNDPLTFVNRVMIYYFFCEIILRYILQTIPAMDVYPYLHLPIPRRRIINFFIIRTLVSLPNSFVLLLFAPFAITVVTNDYGIVTAVIWLLSLLMISLIFHFIILLIKRHLQQSAIAMVSLLFLMCVFVGLGTIGKLDTSTLSENLFSELLNDHTIPLILFSILFFFYIVTYFTLRRALYIDELGVVEREYFSTMNGPFFKKIPLLSTWLKLELKMIFRHKRTREVFSSAILLFFVEVVLCKVVPNRQAHFSFLVFGILCSGMFLVNYGQALFSWQGMHFDFTLTQPTPLRKFVDSKYVLLAGSTALWFLLSVPLVFFHWSFLVINLAAVLYNIGVNLIVVMNMSMWGTKRIDLTIGGSLNYEGMGAAQWGMSIPVIAGPIAIYLPFSLLGYPFAGIFAVGLVGIIGILFRKRLLDLTFRRLYGFRYKMAGNYRKKG